MRRDFNTQIMPGREDRRIARRRVRYGDRWNWGHFVVAAPAPLLLRIVADFLFI